MLNDSLLGVYSLQYRGMVLCFAPCSWTEVRVVEMHRLLLMSFFFSGP